MNELSCPEVQELAAELALDVLPGDERAAVLAHLATCPTCPAEVELLTAAADRLLLALPEAEPPPGFTDRTLATLAAAGGPGGRARSAPVLHRGLAPRSRRLALVVGAVLAAAAVLLAVGLAGRGTGAGPDAVAVSLEGPGGDALGALTLSAGDPPWLEMRLDHGPGDGVITYTCVLDLVDGTSVVIGPLATIDGRGSWGRTLTQPAADVVAARVVDATGSTVATARLS